MFIHEELRVEIVAIFPFILILTLLIAKCCEQTMYAMQEITFETKSVFGVVSWQISVGPFIFQIVSQTPETGIITTKTYRDMPPCSLIHNVKNTDNPYVEHIANSWLTTSCSTFKHTLNGQLRLHSYLTRI